MTEPIWNGKDDHNGPGRIMETFCNETTKSVEVRA